MSKALYLHFGIAAALAGGAVLSEAPAAAENTQNQLAWLVSIGEVLPCEPIRQRIVAETPGQLLDTDFDVASRAYRFRFVRDGVVFNVYVDGRTGQRVRHTSNY